MFADWEKINLIPFPLRQVLYGHALHDGDESPSRKLWRCHRDQLPFVSVQLPGGFAPMQKDTLLQP
jgi:hypothetical protein